MATLESGDGVLGMDFEALQNAHQKLSATYDEMLRTYNQIVRDAQSAGNTSSHWHGEAADAFSRQFNIVNQLLVKALHQLQQGIDIIPQLEALVSGLDAEGQSIMSGKH